MRHFVEHHQSLRLVANLPSSPAPSGYSTLPLNHSAWASYHSSPVQVHLTLVRPHSPPGLARLAFASAHSSPLPAHLTLVPLLLALASARKLHSQASSTIAALAPAPVLPISSPLCDHAAPTSLKPDTAPAPPA